MLNIECMAITNGWFSSIVKEIYRIVWETAVCMMEQANHTQKMKIMEIIMTCVFPNNKLHSFKR